jgi:hypothetical protein
MLPAGLIRALETARGLRHATDRINLSSGMAQPEGGLTTHSTRAEIARMSFVRLDASLNSSRRVNSGVMLLF